VEGKGLARSTVWRAEKRGVFPPRRKISSRGVGWLRSEVEAWLQERRQVGVGDGGDGDGR
jgi:predicted DNA-binding transcriptional regulator AlpA